MAIAVPNGLSGLDLKAERVRRGLRAIDVADRLGVSRQRVSTIEGLLRVSPELARRYFAALGIVDAL